MKLPLTRLLLCTMVSSLSAYGQAAAPAQTPATKAEILAVMEKMTDAQLAVAPYAGGGAPADWVAGAFYVGLARLTHGSENPKYLAAEKAIAEKNAWEFKTAGGGASNIAFADNETIGQLYIDLAVTQKDLAKLDKIKKQWDEVVAGFDDPANIAKWNSSLARDGKPMPWWWCDALFMAPAGMARLSQLTWDRKYLDAMDKQWWVCYDKLYDQDSHLFYRDSKYLTQKTANGKKVFWSRGNGWVYAGLANTLPYVPKDYPTRGKYEVVFKEMAAKLASVQQADGYWRGSLDDAALSNSPETSGTAFFCYGTAWGINNGFLERSKYEPVVEKAWAALNKALRADGLIGWVQAVGEQPGSATAQNTQAYAVGGFLLSGTEIIKMHENK